MTGSRLIMSRLKKAPKASPATKRPISRYVGGSRSRSARACWGMRRRKTSQASGTVESAMAAAQETKTPRTGTAAARATSSTSLPTEKTALPTGTQNALRRPVRTPSWRVSSAQPTEDRVKKIPAERVPRGAYEGPHQSRVSRKIPEAAATTTVLRR
ncbi:hypothetical protein [Streptomyces sp. KL110A]|uniref:hypothetical protein n=1 Tax=Streptomyces sp. KL110A TaxID=3384221 RepID=UPI0038C126BE